MVKTLLLSAAYSWFIGLLVIMLVMAVLFVVIALFALKPYKLEGEEYDGAAEMQRLLNEKEAELAVKLLNADGADKMELEYKLREVATAKLVVKDIISDVDVAASPDFGVDSSLTEEDKQASSPCHGCAARAGEAGTPRAAAPGTSAAAPWGSAAPGAPCAVST